MVVVVQACYCSSRLDFGGPLPVDGQHSRQRKKGQTDKDDGTRVTESAPPVVRFCIAKDESRDGSAEKTADGHDAKEHLVLCKASSGMCSKEEGRQWGKFAAPSLSKER